MSNLTITCDRCRAQIDHQCNTELMPAIVRLYTWSPEAPVLDTKSPYYDPDDEGAPFVSEATLYNLLGKGDARTFLGLLRQVIVAAGIDEMGVHYAVNEEWAKIEAKREEQRQSMERSRLISAIKKRESKGLWVPENQWPLLEHLSKYPDRWQISEPVTRKGVTKKKFVNIPRAEEKTP